MSVADRLRALRFGDVVAADGSRVGSLLQLFGEPSTGPPTWAVLGTGPFDMAHSLVPAHCLHPDGDRAVLDVDPALVDSCPWVDPEDGLTAREEALLRAHYGNRGHEKATD